MTPMRSVAIWAPLLCVLFVGCGSTAPSFTLPNGNAEHGEAAFLQFRCYDCHRVQGVDLPPSEDTEHVSVELGVVDQPRSYADLVTGIINPSHRLAKGYTPSLVSQDGKSRMPVYNDVITVTQLADLVAFLQAHSKVQPQNKTEYRDYYEPR